MILELRLDLDGQNNEVFKKMKAKQPLTFSLKSYLKSTTSMPGCALASQVKVSLVVRGFGVKSFKV
jgi:ADP-glucose pyrophosphorylase